MMPAGMAAMFVAMLVLAVIYAMLYRGGSGFTEGARFVMRDVPGEPVLICADSIGMLQPDDAGRIVVTASSRGEACEGG